MSEDSLIQTQISATFGNTISESFGRSSNFGIPESIGISESIQISESLAKSHNKSRSRSEIQTQSKFSSYLGSDVSVSVSASYPKSELESEYSSRSRLGSGSEAEYASNTYQSDFEQESLASTEEILSKAIQHKISSLKRRERAEKYNQRANPIRKVFLHKLAVLQRPKYIRPRMEGRIDPYLVDKLNTENRINRINSEMRCDKDKIGENDEFVKMKNAEREILQKRFEELERSNFINWQVEKIRGREATKRMRRDCPQYAV